MSKMHYFRSLLPILLWSSAAWGVGRIQSVKIDRTKPYPVYMHPGRVTTIDMPCSISYAIPGSHGDVQTEIGPDKDSSLVVWLTSESSAATNLTVRCANKVVVFDIIPSRTNHQDYLNVTALENALTNKRLVASSETYKGESASFRKKKLIRSSGGK